MLSPVIIFLVLVLLSGVAVPSPQDSLGKAILQAHLPQGLVVMHAHESTTGSSHKNVTGSCEGGEHTRIVRMQLMGCFTG